MSGALIPEVLLTFGFLLVPGMGLCLASRLTVDRSLFTTVALAFGLGFAGVGLGCLVLVLLGALTPTSLAISWVAVSAVGWFLAFRGHPLRRQAEGWAGDARADPLATLGALLILAGVGMVRWTVAPVANIAPTALRYWADALEIADAGRIPKGTLQWGIVIPPTTSKVVLNSFNAGASMLLGRDPIEPTGALLYVVSIGLVITAIALFRELGMVRLAPVAAILLFANGLTGSELTTDLGFNLAENWGRLVGLSAVLAAVVVFWRRPGDADHPESGTAEDPSTRAAVLPGILLATAAGTHLVAASCAIAMVCGLVLAQALVWRRARSLAVRAAVTIGVGVGLGAVVLVSPPGDLGFGGAGGTSSYRELRAELGLPPSFDPTRFIVTHDMEAAGETTPRGVGDVAEAFAYRAIGHRAPNERTPSNELPIGFLIVPTILALLLLGAALRWAPRDLIATMLWAVIVASVLFTVGVTFALRFDLFVLEVFGDRRLFTYALIPYVAILIAGGEWAFRSIGRATRAGIASMTAFAVVVGCGLVFLPHATWVKASDRANLENQLELIRWVGSHVPCEGRVLMNRRTLGTFESIAGRAAVVEGMGPHIRPSILVRAIEEIVKARAFFRHPLERSDFLERRGVAAVIIGTSGNPFGGYPALPGVRPGRLAALGGLTLAFQNPSGSVYLVDDFRPDRSLPRVFGRPGFACQGPRTSPPSASSTRSTSPVEW
jgi:hypothetical protein